MDLSPKLLTDVQFREQWRGYNPDEVDEFLERVASGVEELQQRLNEAVARASEAERRLLERSDEDEIRRTLVLAQRTAVASMEEARTEADRLVSETEARCRQLVAEAEAQSARVDADIATRRRIELGDLAEQRAALQLDIEHLQRFLDGERERLGQVLRGQIEWIDAGYALAELPSVSTVVAPPPAPSHVPAPAAAPAPVSAPVEMKAPEPIEAAADVDDDDPFAPLADLDDDEPVISAAEEQASAVDELRLAREELADALRRAGVDAEDDVEVEVVDDDAPLQLEPQLPRKALYDDRVGEPTASFDALAAEEPEDEPLWRDDDPAAPVAEDDDDPFLAELRRAVGDTEPLGPREDDHDAVLIDRETDEAPDRGFLRRGRRRG